MLLPIYMKFGGAVCVCLRRWLDAEEVPEGTEFEPLKKTYNPILGKWIWKLLFFLPPCFDWSQKYAVFTARVRVERDLAKNGMEEIKYGVRNILIVKMLFYQDC